MTIKEVIDFYKATSVERYRSTGVPELARALGVTRVAVWNWVRDGTIPIDRQCQIEVITQGALLADREQLALMDAKEASA